MSKIKQAILSSAGLVRAAMVSALILSSATAAASTTLAGTSSSTCPDVAAAISQAANNVYNQAQNTYTNLVPQPQNLSSSTCFSSIINMGSSIGLSFFNPATLIQQLEQMVCNAAQQALQWPLQQVNNTINQNGQLPYGMGGVSAQQSATPGVSVSTFTSSGPSVGSLSTGNSNTLSSALGG